MTFASQALRGRVLEALEEVIEPELGVNIIELGLVYAVEVAEDGDVRVALTTTTPTSSLAERLATEAEGRIRDVAGVARAHVGLVWEPPWSPARMSSTARGALGW